MKQAGDAIVDGEDPAPYLVERRAAPPRIDGGGHRREHRLEALGALDAVGHRDAERLGSGDDLGEQFHEFRARGRERLDQRVGGRRAAVLHLARGFGELRAQIGKATGEAGQLAGQGVEIHIHSRRQESILGGAAAGCQTPHDVTRA